jgi:hypothetical protein
MPLEQDRARHGVQAGRRRAEDLASPRRPQPIAKDHSMWDVDVREVIAKPGDLQSQTTAACHAFPARGTLRSLRSARQRLGLRALSIGRRHCSCPEEHPLARIARNISRLIFAALIAILTAWASLALWYRLPAQELMRALAGTLFFLIGVAAILALFTRGRQLVLVSFLAAFAAVLAWWTTIAPKAHGDWAPDVARQATGTIDGDVLTLTNVRDFDWRSSCCA